MHKCPPGTQGEVGVEVDGGEIKAENFFPCILIKETGSDSLPVFTLPEPH